MCLPGHGELVYAPPILGLQQDGKRLQSQVHAPLARIGTRGSPLALVQARLVRSLIAAAQGVGEDQIEIVTITTSGDRITDRPLSEVGGKGLFTKEIEAALIAGEIDLAVHSSKDVSTVLPDGLELPVFLEREDVRDAFISLTAKSIDDLPQGARLGTSSIRRAAQFLRYRPDLQVVGFRGNVDTRLKKLEDGVADATLLASAGLNRLGKADRITQLLDPQKFPPAPAQGAIALEIRADDAKTRALIAPLNHEPTAVAVRAERALLRKLDGSCRTPIAAFSSLGQDSVTLFGQLLSPDGQQCFEASLSGAWSAAEQIGHDVGEKLLAMAGPDFIKAYPAV
jgi:hydroxymethylbilane synthase